MLRQRIRQAETVRVRVSCRQGGGIGGEREREREEAEVGVGGDGSRARVEERVVRREGGRSICGSGADNRDGSGETKWS